MYKVDWCSCMGLFVIGCCIVGCIVVMAIGAIMGCIGCFVAIIEPAAMDSICSLLAAIGSIAAAIQHFLAWIGQMPWSWCPWCWLWWHSHGSDWMMTVGANFNIVVICDIFTMHPAVLVIVITNFYFLGTNGCTGDDIAWSICHQDLLLLALVPSTWIPLSVFGIVVLIPVVASTTVTVTAAVGPLLFLLLQLERHLSHQWWLLVHCLAHHLYLHKLVLQLLVQSC